LTTKRDLEAEESGLAVLDGGEFPPGYPGIGKEKGWWRKEREGRDVLHVVRLLRGGREAGILDANAPFEGEKAEPYSPGEAFKKG